MPATADPKKQLLFLSRWFPYPPDNGSRTRVYNLIKELGPRFDVTLVTFCDPDQGNRDDIEALKLICSAVYTVPTPSFSLKGLRPALAFFSPLPRWIIASDSSQLRGVLKEISGQKFDLCLASEIDMARYALEVSGCPRILEDLEVSVILDRPARERHPLKKFRSQLTAHKHRRYLARVLSTFDGISTVSEVEKKAILRNIPGLNAIGVIPNGVDLTHFSGNFGEAQPDTLIYAGALTYHANQDAVQYFLAEIFPLVLKQDPWVKLTITGKTRPDLLEELPLERYSTRQVRFPGYLTDIRPAVAQSWASIVPLRIGGGTRLKILESLALGTPVVTTSKGMEGLDLEPGKDLLTGDSPEEFSAAVTRLLRDPDLRRRLSEQGKIAVARCYGWTAIGHQLRDFLAPFLVQS